MPTLGYTTPGTGGSDSNSSGVIVALGPYTASASGPLADGHLYCTLGGGTPTQAFRLILYADSSGLPGTILGITDEVVVGANGWADFPTWTAWGGAPSVVSGTAYHIGIWWGTKAGTGTVFQWWDGVGGADYFTTTAGYSSTGSPSSTPTTLDSSSRSYSAYFTINSGPLTITLSASASSTATLSSLKRKILAATAVSLPTIVRLPGRILSAAAGVSSYSQVPIALGMQGSVVSVTTQVIGSAAKTLIASVSSTSLLSRIATRILNTSASSSATVTTFRPVAIPLTASASVLAQPIMWFRRALRMIPAVITSMSGSAAETVELTMDPDEHA